MSNLPPGVTGSMIPGNRPSDLAAEAQGDNEAEFYQQFVEFYGLGGHAHKAMRTAFLKVDPDNREWLDDVDRDVEASEILLHIGDITYGIEAAVADHDTGRSGDPEGPNAPDWVAGALEEKERLLERLKALCTHNLERNTGHADKAWAHEQWCPDRPEELE